MMMPKLWWWILLLSINFFDAVVFSDPIFQAHTGMTIGRSSREPKYNIEFHPADAPFHPDDGRESLVMSNSNGEKYMCFLPKPEKPKTENSQQNLSSIIMGMERRLIQKTPDELLEALKDRCFLREEGWWSYEFCYQKKLRQIHVEDEKVVQEFVLGVYDAAATEAYHQNLSDISFLKDPRSKDASQRYHAHQYTNGTICDLTNQPRETEVRFVCSEPRGMITSITELSTCKYALTVQCPILCKHPLFQEEKPVLHTIHCSALSKEEGKMKKGESVEDEKIAMITALLPNFNSDGYAT